MKPNAKRPRRLYAIDKPALWKKRITLYGELAFWAATFAGIWVLIPLQT